jgi:hypothetical protein
MDGAIPAYTDAYQAMVAQLERAGGDTEAVFRAIEQLREAVAATSERLESDVPRSA